MFYSIFLNQILSLDTDHKHNWTSEIEPNWTGLWGDSPDSTGGNRLDEGLVLWQNRRDRCDRSCDLMVAKHVANMWPNTTKTQKRMEVCQWLDVWISSAGNQQAQNPASSSSLRWQTKVIGSITYIEFIYKCCDRSWSCSFRGHISQRLRWFRGETTACRFRHLDDRPDDGLLRRDSQGLQRLHPRAGNDRILFKDWCVSTKSKAKLVKQGETSQLHLENLFETWNLMTDRSLHWSLQVLEFASLASNEANKDDPIDSAVLRAYAKMKGLFEQQRGSEKGWDFGSSRSLLKVSHIFGCVWDNSFKVRTERIGLEVTYQVTMT